MQRVIDLYNKAFTIMDRVLDQWRARMPNSDPTDVPGITDVFRYKHAANIRDLTNDLLFLYQNRRLRGLRMMCRPIVESFFSFCASYVQQDYAVTKIASEFRDQEARVTKWNALYPLGTMEAVHGAAMLAQTRQHLIDLEFQLGITIANKQWDMFSVAQITRYPNQYRAAYFTYSLWTHCTFMSLATRGDINEANSCVKAMVSFLIMTLGEIQVNDTFPAELTAGVDSLLIEVSAINNS